MLPKCMKYAGWQKREWSAAQQRLGIVLVSCDSLKYGPSNRRRERFGFRLQTDISFIKAISDHR